MTIYWAPLLHIYQPPTQDVEILRIIDKECYKPLFTRIDKHDSAKFCLNINGVLIELLYEYGLDDTMDLLKNLVSEKKIEILGTGKFHPILPLIPENEVYNQIRLNEEINKREFGNNWVKSGFFPPEMAISPNIVNIIRNLDYKWVIMSGIACPVEDEGVDWPYDKIYTSSNGLQLLFRDDVLSNKISFKKFTAKDFVANLKKIYNNEDETKKNNNYVLTAMDGETFGHHIKNYEKIFLGKVLELIDDDDEIENIFISELDQYFPIAKKKVTPRKSSWSTNNDNLQEKVPYPLWHHPENDVHKYYWKIMKSLNNLLNLADILDFTGRWDVENYYNTARWFYNQGLNSCPTWWSNSLRGMWSPNLIYKGVELLLRAALNAQLALTQAGMDEGDGYFDSITYSNGLLLMELYSVAHKNLKNKKKKSKQVLN